MTSESVPVVIVGAGPVGLTLANLLGLQGIPVVVLERNPSTVSECRAVSMDDEAMRILAATGLLETLTADMRLGVRAAYHDSRGRMLFEVDPSRCSYGHPFISFFLQPQLEAGLAEGTRRFEHVQVRFLHTVERFTQDETGVTVEGHDAEKRPFSLRARYLLGCDGGRSTVRAQLGIRLLGSTYKERWLVLDTNGHEPDRRQVTFYCDPARPTVSVPMPHGYHRWEFLLHASETDAEMTVPEKMAELLSRHADPRSHQIIRKVVYPFHARTAERYRQGRVLLAGDAAHLMPPFAGQGMCSGLRDAHNLSWKLAAILQGRAGDRLLETYEAERFPHARKMTRLSMALGQIVMARSRAVAFTRDTLFHTLQLAPEIMAFLREFKFKPTPRILAGLLWKDLERGPWTGQMLPQPKVRTARGEEVLLDRVLGSDFSLVALNTGPSFALPPALLERWRRLAPRHITLVRPGATRGPLGEEEVVDLDGMFAEGGEKSSGFCLVRPDRYVAAHFQADQAPRVAEFLERVLQPS